MTGAPPARVGQLTRSGDASHGQLAENCIFAASCEIAGVVMELRTAGSGASAALEPIDAATALPAITRWFDARGDLMDRVTRAISLLRGLHCFRLILGTPDETAVAIGKAISALGS